MRIELAKNDKLEVSLEGTDGLITIHFDDEKQKFTIHADLPDSSGRVGIVYQEDFGNYEKTVETIAQDEDSDDDWASEDGDVDEEDDHVSIKKKEKKREQSIRDRLVNIIADVISCERATVKDTKSLRDDLGMDDLDENDLQMAIEEEFGIELSDQALDEVQTVKDLLDVIMKVEE
jgi:acyl carrier protein